MSYPTPEQIENCGRAEVKKLAEDFLKIKQDELLYSLNLDFSSISFLNEQEAKLKGQFLLFMKKMERYQDSKKRNLETLRKVQLIREKHKAFEIKKKEAIRSRRVAELGLASYENRLNLFGDFYKNAKWILHQFWTDTRFTDWSKIMFGQLAEEWKRMRLTEEMDKCLVETEEFVSTAG